MNLSPVNLSHNHSLTFTPWPECASGRLGASMGTMMNRTDTVPALRGLRARQERQKLKQVIATSPTEGYGGEIQGATGTQCLRPNLL